MTDLPSLDALSPDARTEGARLLDVVAGRRALPRAWAERHPSALPDTPQEARDAVGLCLRTLCRARRDGAVPNEIARLQAAATQAVRVLINSLLRRPQQGPATRANGPRSDPSKQATDATRLLATDPGTTHHEAAARGIHRRAWRDARRALGITGAAHKVLHVDRERFTAGCQAQGIIPLEAHMAGSDNKALTDSATEQAVRLLAWDPTMGCGAARTAGIGGNSSWDAARKILGIHGRHGLTTWHVDVGRYTIACQARGITPHKDYQMPTMECAPEDMATPTSRATEAPGQSEAIHASCPPCEAAVDVEPPAAIVESPAYPSVPVPAEDIPTTAHVAAPDKALRSRVVALVAHLDVSGAREAVLDLAAEKSARERAYLVALLAQAAYTGEMEQVLITLVGRVPVEALREQIVRMIVQP